MIKKARHRLSWTQSFNIICGTPCLGKTTLAQRYSNVIDLESSPFKYLDYDRALSEQKKGCWEEKNPNYISDYINAIQEAVGANNIVLLPMHEDIREEMDKLNLSFAIAYSTKRAKQDVINRFYARGNDENFIQKVMSKFDSRLLLMESDSHIKIPVGPGLYLEDALKNYQKRHR